MQTNFEGKDKFGSIHGVVLSLVYYTLMILYIYKVTYRLLTRHNPDIAYTESHNFFAHDEKFSMSKNNIEIAFAVTNYLTNEPLDSSEYV